MSPGRSGHRCARRMVQIARGISAASEGRHAHSQCLDLGQTVLRAKALRHYPGKAGRRLDRPTRRADRVPRFHGSAQAFSPVAAQSSLFIPHASRVRRIPSIAFPVKRADPGFEFLRLFARSLSCGRLGKATFAGRMQGRLPCEPFGAVVTSPLSSRSRWEGGCHRPPEMSLRDAGGALRSKPA